VSARNKFHMPSGPPETKHTNVMELSPSHDECANVVEAKFVESTLDHFVLLAGVNACSGGDGRKPE
jgi:hypothetical protein